MSLAESESPLMRLSIRPITRATALRLASAGLLAAILAGGLFAYVRPTHATSTAAPHATLSTISAAGFADPLHASASATDTTPGAQLPRGVRTLHPKHAISAATAPRGGAAALAPVTPAALGTLQSNFNGVSSLDSAVTNFGAEFEPPDQGLCVGNGFVVEPVNSAFTIYHTGGSVVAGPFNVNDLFKEGPRQFTSDPRCYFDATTNTWFAIILFINAKGTVGRTDLAVNSSGDPTTRWTVYQIDATDIGKHGEPSHPGCPCLGDQPLLGIDDVNLYISTNEFSILGPQFNGAQIYAISKAELVAGRHSIHVVHFDNLNIGGAIAFSVQPAITNGPADAEYFLSSLDLTGNGDNRLGVWAMTNREAVAAGGIPTLSSVVITSEAYSPPPFGIQLGGQGIVLDSGDDRMQQAQFIGGSLWASLDTAFVPDGEFFPVAAAAWFKVTPHLQGQTIAGANLDAQGYLVSDQNFLLYPAIQADSSGNAAMVFTITGPTLYPSAAYALLTSGQTTFGDVQIAAPGTGPYSPSSTRWGDYSWAVLAPDQNSFWLATEYIPPIASQTPDGLQNWGTCVMQVSAI